ncbi:MAG: hypothetical protein HYZ57_04105 [Acidobacteria bacterium]|nr:hypothetical protein [Acidobacteriota bacterium]
MQADPKFDPRRQDQPPADELDPLWAAYRAAVPDPEPSANFMPQLWTRIEAQQRVTYVFGRLGRLFVTAAAACCLIMSLLLWQPQTPASTVYSATYVDLLDEQAGVAAMEVPPGGSL